MRRGRDSAQDAIVESLIARLGKRPDAHLIGIGTPGFDPNVLQRIRAAHHDGELPVGVRYLEHAAAAGCDVFDRAAWADANPALRAGFLAPGALEVQAGMLTEREFRTYHLGQWVDTAHGWLPDGAWELCAQRAAAARRHAGGARGRGHVPPHAWRSSAPRSTAPLFFGWAKEAATDDEVRDVLTAAAEQYEVVEVCRPKRIRPTLFAELAELGMPVTAWDAGADNEAQSANEFYRAITEGTLAHDHDELVAQHVARVRIRWAVDGSLRLGRPDDGGFADAAFAARAAWWRAGKLAAEVPDQPLAIY